MTFLHWEQTSWAITVLGGGLGLGVTSTEGGACWLLGLGLVGHARSDDDEGY